MAMKRLSTLGEGIVEMTMDENRSKAAVSESAAALVTDGMLVGLGSGTIAAFAVSALGRRVRDGLRITGIPTSENTAAQARALGIPLTSLTATSQIDMTIDGADEVHVASQGTIRVLRSRTAPFRDGLLTL